MNKLYGLIFFLSFPFLVYGGDPEKERKPTDLQTELRQRLQDRSGATQDPSKLVKEKKEGEAITSPPPKRDLTALHKELQQRNAQSALQKASFPNKVRHMIGRYPITCCCLCFGTGALVTHYLKQ